MIAMENRKWQISDIMNTAKPNTKFQGFFYFFWLLIVLLIIGAISYDPNLLQAEHLAGFIQKFEQQILLIYIFISIVRGLFLIPSTPFVLTGILLFPEQPWLVFLISIAGILLTTAMLYYFSDALGFSEKLQRKFPKKMEVWQKRLRSRHAIWIVIGWAFFPFVPTDLICYIAGIVKMPFKYLMCGVLIGESILVAIYVWFGAGMLGVLFP
jgi:uncharacterized membrane protein YdjX (TVP38/TMEM64 family)